VLRLPVPAGTIVLCQQGNRSPLPQSHAYPNCLHALDLSTPGSAAVDVVAAARGTVARVVAGAKAGDVDPGMGFGNHVTIAHDGGFFTLYAHLADAKVKAGDRVLAGDVLGTMGDTGKAGNVHVHFSLHRGDGVTGVPDTVPMHGLVAADLTKSAPFALATSLELACAESRLARSGHLYGSENAPRTPPRFGPPDAVMSGAFAREVEIRLAAIPLPSDAEEIAKQASSLGPAKAREQLEAIAARSPDDVIAHYWIAVLSLRDLDDVPRAKRALEVIRAKKPAQPPWIGPWTSLRWASVAEKEGRVADARRIYEEARAVTDQGAEFERFVREGLARTDKPAAKPPPTKPGQPKPQSTLLDTRN
jgi:hypothetical protein